MNYKDDLLKLDWNNSQEKVEEGINSLIRIDDEKLIELIQPLDKKYWANAAEVLRRIGYPRLNSISSELFLWLQDLNWPGALVIRDLLLEMDDSLLLRCVRENLKKAKEMEDSDWEEFIMTIVESKDIKL